MGTRKLKKVLVEEKDVWLSWNNYTSLEESVASTKNTQQMVSGLIKCIADTEEIAVLLKEYANTLDEQIGYFVTEI